MMNPDAAAALKELQDQVRLLSDDVALLRKELSTRTSTIEDPVHPAPVNISPIDTVNLSALGQILRNAVKGAEDARDIENSTNPMVKLGI